MRLGSLCTGYGGLDMAVEAHYGADLAWYSEIDKDCSQLLAHHWPTQPNLGDLTTIGWDQVDPVDVLCAGFPCQPFSHAGKREGENDDRAIFAYIADAIGVLRQRRRQPRIVVLEKVAGILTLGGPGVVGTLTGLGYDLRWGVVRASDAGAPHRRARWFCVATNAEVVHGAHGRQAVEDQGCVQVQPRRGDSSATDTEGAERRTEEHETVGAPIGSTSEPRERTSATSWDCYEPAIRRWERTIGRPAPAPTDDGKLSSRFVEWMMGLSQGHVCGLGLSRTAELKMIGNGVCPQQATLALTLLDE